MPNLRKLLKEAGCKDGICWTQGFLQENGSFCALEMGYRNDGNMMTFLVHQATGFDTMSWLLDTSLGVAHSSQDLPRRDSLNAKQYTCQVTVMSHKQSTISRIEGMEFVEQIPGIRMWTNVEENQQIAAHAMMARLIFDADTIDELCDMVGKINTILRIYDENGENLVEYFDNFESIRKALDR